MSVFNKYSEYYDLLNKDKDYDGEVCFINNLVSEYNKEAKSILEFGSGTGRHAELLAKKYDQVTGVDLSSSMVELALKRKKEASDKLSFEVGNITDHRFSDKGDVAISLFHVMSYLTSLEQVKMTLKNVYDQLNPNGIFIFDFWYAPAVLFLKPDAERVRVFENNHLKINRKSLSALDSNTKTVEVKFEIEIESKESKEVNKLNEVHLMRYFDLDELKPIFKEVGFDLIKANEWMTNEPLSEKTWGAYVVLKK